MEATRRDVAQLAVAASPVGLLSAALELTGGKPDPWQVKALSSPASRLAIVASRQVGKGSVAAAAALHCAAYRPGSLILIVSASERQARVVIDRVREMLTVLGRHAEGLVETLTELRFANGSVLRVLPSTSTSLRGWSCHYLVVDEASFVETVSWHALVPTTAATGGRILALSSAGQPEGWFYDVVTRPDQYPEWERITVTADQVSRLRPEFLAGERRRLPDATYRREYLAEFTGSALGPFEPLLVARAMAAGREQPRPGANPFDLSDLFRRQQ